MRGVRVCLLGLDIRAELLRVHSIVQGLFSDPLQNFVPLGEGFWGLRVPQVDVVLHSF